MATKKKCKLMNVTIVEQNFLISENYKESEMNMLAKMKEWKLLTKLLKENSQQNYLRLT